MGFEDFFLLRQKWRDNFLLVEGDGPLGLKGREGGKPDVVVKRVFS